MNEIEKILKDNMEDYESVKRQALKFSYGMGASDK